MISYLSKSLLSNPYVPPVSIDLMAKVLSFRETNFKQNAAKIQQSLDTVSSTDLIKDEDKQYLNQKLNNLTNSLDNLGGVDLGDINVANSLNQSVSNIYSDNDLLESISSTQRARKLQSSYEKLQSDPKLRNSFATQNMTYDMQSLNAWVNNGKRTTADDGYTGPTNPTPFFDIDKAMVERAKVVKANYTESTVKDGLYIHKVTGEEVTTEQIKNEIKQQVYENPQMLKQAEINSWYINPNVTGADLYKKTVDKVTSTRDFVKKDYDEYLKIYETMPDQQKLEKASVLESKRQNLANFDKTLKEYETKGVEEFNNNISGYRTQMYIDGMTDHLAQSLSYSKFTDEAKPDLATAAFLKNQIEAKDKGFLIVPDPTSASGFNVIPDPDYDPTTKTRKSTTSTKNDGTGVDGNNFDITTQGQLMNNLNTENKVEWTDESVAKTILDKNDQKQVLMQGLIKDLINMNPELVKTLGKDAAQAALISEFARNNDPDRIEIEDFKDAKGKFMSKAQTEAVSNLYKSFEAIKQGKPPLIDLTDAQIETFKKIQNLNEETNFYTELLQEHRGATENLLSSGERAAIVKNSKGENLSPEFISAKVTGATIDGSGLSNLGIDFKTQAPTIDVIYNAKTKKYVPRDGKEHTFKNVKIPVDGVTGQQVQELLVPGGWLIKEREVDKNYLYGFNVIKTQSQLDYRTAAEKTKGAKPPNSKAYDILNETHGYYNYALPQDIKAQKADGTLNKLKTAMFAELENGSIDFKTKGPDGYTTVKGQQSLNDVDKEKSYISRVGTSTSDPTQMDVEIVIVSKGTTKVPSAEVGKIVRPLRQDEAAQLGIQQMNREILMENKMIEFKGRTAPKTYTPMSKDKFPKLVIDMEVVAQDNNGSKTFVPQIMVPLNGKMQRITLAGGKTPMFPNLTGKSVNEVKQLFQTWLNVFYTNVPNADNNILYKTLTEQK